MGITEIENALRGWVLLASGYDEGKVIWSHENGNRPPGNVITLSLVGVQTIGAVDAVEHHVDLGRPAGQEIEQRVRGEREHVLRIQAFTPEDVNGETSARAVLMSVQTKARLPEVTEALDLVGVSLFDLGSIQYVPAIANTTFEGRGVLEVRLYATDTASAFTGFVSEVDGNGALDGGIGSVPVEIDVAS